MKVTLSEAIDRISILAVKKLHLEKRGDTERVKALEAERLALSCYARGIVAESDCSDPEIGGSDVIDFLSTKLLEVNSRIFDCVDTIESDATDDTTIASAAREAQRLNRERSRIKNAIEEAVGSEVREVKI